MELFRFLRGGFRGLVGADGRHYELEQARWLVDAVIYRAWCGNLSQLFPDLCADTESILGGRLDCTAGGSRGMQPTRTRCRIFIRTAYRRPLIC